jgi:hypothetical protein
MSDEMWDGIATVFGVICAICAVTIVISLSATLVAACWRVIFNG